MVAKAKRKSFVIDPKLADGLTQTVNSAKSYASEMRYEAVPLSKIEVDPENPRDLALGFSDLPQGPEKTDPLYGQKKEEMKSLESLAHSITQEGVLNAVIVFKHNDKYRLIAGERRCLASLIAGKEFINAKILDQRPDKLKKSVIQWVENIERADLSLWEKLNNLKSVINFYEQEHGVSLNSTSLSDFLGCSRVQASFYLAVMAGSENVMSSIQRGELNSLERAAYIARLESDESRDLALNLSKNVNSLKELKELVSKSDTAQNDKTKRNKKGRKVSKVNLGQTKATKVVETLISLFTEKETGTKYKDQFQQFDLSNPSDASAAFGKLVKILEKL